MAATNYVLIPEPLSRCDDFLRLRGRRPVGNTVLYIPRAIDAQGIRRGVHFGDRARGAKIGPFEEGGGVRVDVENVSNGFCGEV